MSLMNKSARRRMRRQLAVVLAAAALASMLSWQIPKVTPAPTLMTLLMMEPPGLRKQQLCLEQSYRLRVKSGALRSCPARRGRLIR
jgi:hypothetical protein